MSKQSVLLWSTAILLWIVLEMTKVEHVTLSVSMILLCFIPNGPGHVAWRAQGRLEVIIETLKFNQDNDAVIAQLETAIADVVEAIGDMRAGPREAEHYER